MNYNELGHVCSETGRKCVRAYDYANSEFNGDHYAYLYSEELEEMGLDPWRAIDGIDLYLDGERAELWFDNGGSLIVDVTESVYISRKTAEAWQ